MARVISVNPLCLTAPSTSLLPLSQTSPQARKKKQFFHGKPGKVARVSCGRADAETVPLQVEERSLPSDRVLLSQGDSKIEICRALNGMWQVSHRRDWGARQRDAAVDSMLDYIDAGLTTFDMADHYGPAEDLFGILINRVRNERGDELAGKIQALTKWVPRPGKMTRQIVEENIDRSRRRMDVKTLDMLQFHWWDYEDSGYLDALKHMTDLVGSGKIRTLALTNFDTKRLAQILEEEIPIVSNQVQHSLVDMRPQAEMAQLCSLMGVQLITYGTICGGLLSEKYLDKREPNTWGGPTLDTPSLQKYKRMVDAWGGWELFQSLLRECKLIARKHGVAIPAVALRYILDQTAVGGSMVGVRLGVAEHIRDTKSVFQFELDDEDRARIHSVTSKGRDLMLVIGDCGDEYRRS
eukprot:TRINITY_DN16309_c0_g2_i1.p1 TRINITY_DN16309_c0_g2~~TRINITY_DN16309_c0_g2_i1.p1  ORF type:complete len:410 (+),score=60.72 TRINITY_DN16309_c0_g2_i1:149-1378(+)